MTDAKYRELEEGCEQPSPTTATCALPGQVVSPEVGVEDPPETSLKSGSSALQPGTTESSKSLESSPSFLVRTTSASQELLASLSRNVSRALESSISIRTLRCNICLMNIPVTECSVLEGCAREEHSCCTSCLSMYLKLRIEEGRIGDLQCPCADNDGCEAKATESELERLLAQEIIEKYRRFSRMQDDSTLRACPQCNKLCAPQLRRGTQALRRGCERKVMKKEDLESDAKEVVAEMVCEGCGCAFCYYHSNAHARGPKACSAYEREILNREKKLAKSYDARKCPKCGVLTKKTDGCNHMTCTCQADWCWVCGKEITNIRRHYNPMMPSSCDQFREPKTHPIRLTLLRTFTKLFMWPASIITLLFVALFAAIFIVLFLLIMAVLLPGVLPFSAVLNKDDWSLVMKCLGAVCTLGAGIPTAILVGVPFLLFCAVWCIIALPLWLLLVPCGADKNRIRLLMLAPLFSIFMILERVSPRH